MMTVCCRSNDIIWGAYGANAVHMSMLQEFMAGCIGVPVGRYYQVSDNYHAYHNVYHKLLDKFLEMDAFDFYGLKSLRALNPYTLSRVKSYPMFARTETGEIKTTMREWELDLAKFMGRTPFQDNIEYTDPFFAVVAEPIQDSWFHHKLGDRDAAMELVESECMSTDWARACYEWLDRRKPKE